VVVKRFWGVAGVSLGARVRFVLALLVVVPVLMVVAVLATEPTTEAVRQDLRSRLEPGRLQLEQLRSAMVDQETGLRGYLLASDPSFLEPYRDGRRRTVRLIAELHRSLRGMGFDRQMDESESAIASWQALAEQGRTQRLSDTEALRVRKASFDDVRAALDALEDSLQAEIAAASARYDRVRDLQRRLLGGMIVVSAVLAVVGASLLTRWLRRPLEILGAAADAAAADPEESMALHGPAEVAALAARLEAMRRSVLDESQARLRRGLVVAQEDERRRIAAGLHDEVIQSLVAVDLRLQALAASADDDDRELLDGAGDAVNDAIDHLRSLLFELYPPALERHGLVAALESFGAGLDPAGAVKLVLSGDVGDASTTVQAIAYRAAREVVSNAYRHAGARSIDIRIVTADRALRVAVRDDGRGFDPASARDRPGHLGLDAAEELVVGSLGHWALRSVAGEGTVVELSIPDPDTG
jgi:signal transduction histidine kinase